MVRQSLPNTDMDPTSGYDSWLMQQNGNVQPSWQLGPNAVSQSSMPDSAAPMYAASPSSSSGPAASSLYPALPGPHGQYMQQPASSFQQQQGGVSFPPQVYSHHQQQHQQQQLYGSFSNMASMPSSGIYPAAPLSIDEATFNELRAAYPNTPPDFLINAVLHSPQHFPAAQLAPPPQPTVYASSPHSYASAPSNNEQFQSQSDHSLANALTFSSPSSRPANQSSGSINGMPQSVAPPHQAQAGSSDVAAPSTASSSSAGAKDKQPKLRQSKLAFLPGVAKSLSQKETPLPPAPIATNTPTTSVGAEITVITDSGSEPGTPPLPPAKALSKPSTKGNAGAAVVKGGADAKGAEARKLWEMVKQPLSRLSVEREPAKAVHKFVAPLSDLDPGGKFRNPRPTAVEDRKIILDMLNSIVKLETGKGYSKTGRERFFAALMGSYAARHILSAWLRATTPPKKASQDVVDESAKYQSTLPPLLSILAFVEMKRDYLTDDAALGKAITGVSLRAVDPSARKAAQDIKAKWTKVVEDADTKAAAPPRPSPSAPANAPSTKRKPADGAATAVEGATKRYKSASAAAATSTSAKATKATPSSAGTSTAASSRPAPAQAGVDFFAAGSVKKQVVARPPSTASAAGPSRPSAHHNVMSLIDKVSGGAGSSRAASGTSTAQPASSQLKKKAPKRVRWKEDSELVAVKLIEPADYGQGEMDEEIHIEGAGDKRHEGAALKQTVSTMEALMDWQEPRELSLAVDSDPIGSESVEGPFQTQRHAGLERTATADGEEESGGVEESNLEQPGSISETPAELAGAETAEIPTPWMEEAEADLDVTGEGQGIHEVAVKDEGAPNDDMKTSDHAAIPAAADISALLAKVGQTVGADASAISSTGTQTAAPAPALNFDLTQLQSILNAAKGADANSNTVNAALASSNVTSDNLSNLLSSLSRSNGQNVPSTSDAGEQPSYWQRPQRDNVPVNAAQEESYPGEFQGDYQPDRKSSYNYGQTSAPRGYRYGGGDNGGWDSEQSSYGGYQYGGSGDGGQGGYGGGGGGNGGGIWQSKRHTVPCKFFAQGTCRNGSSCNFRH